MNAVIFDGVADYILAFCRVFRIGQNSETFVTRFVIEDSVDEKIEKLQDAKAKKIAAVMDDPKMLGKLTLDELLRLFGPVVYENHQPIIVDKNVKEGGSTSQVASFPRSVTEFED